MATRPSLFADGDQAVHRARHRAAHEQEIALGVDPDHTQPELGEIAGAHMPGHPFALDDARGIGAWRNRSRLAVTRVAVGFGTAVEVMAVDDALEAAAFRHTAHLHAIAFGEDGDRDRTAGRRCVTRDGEATNDAWRRFDAALFHVAGERFWRALGFLRAKPQPGS